MEPCEAGGAGREPDAVSGHGGDAAGDRDIGQGRV